MTLLKYLRQELSSKEDIHNLIKHSRCPDGWSAQSISSFTEELRTKFAWDNKVCELADRIYANEEIDDCHDCNELMFYDDSVSCYEGDYHVCQQCSDDNYSWSDYRGTMIHYEDYDEDEYDDGQQSSDGNFEYCHRVENDLGFQRLPHEKHSEDLLYYGVELEVERRKSCPSEMPHHIMDNVLSGFAQCKSDGSLDNGFEITTCPATFGKHKESWESFFKDKLCMDNLKGWNTDTAGLHIHISRSALLPTDIGKILVFVNEYKNNDLINGIAGRSSDQWAKKSPKKISDFRNHSEKYEAVNTAHNHTIELRIFKSNVSKHGFYRVLEFVDALVHFVKQTGLTGMSLHQQSFFRYMNKQEIKCQYPNLSAWLIRKGYISGKPSRQVSWQGELQNTAN